MSATSSRQGPAPTAGRDWVSPPGDEQGLMDWFSLNRERDPVRRGPRGDWHVFGYAESVECLSNHADFSNATVDVPATSALKLFGAGNLTWMDPPEHRRLRSAITGIFSARYTQAIEPQVRAITADLMDMIRYCDSIPLIDGFTFPIMLRSIMGMLGVPSADSPIFGHWLKSLLAISTGTANVVALFAAQTRDMDRALHQLIDERRRIPRDDLITRLMSPQPDGGVFTDDEIVGLIGLLIATAEAGSTQTLANVVICLDRFPEVAARVRADPNLLDRVIEETMRYRNQAVRVERRTTRELVFFGHEIPANTSVSVWLSSANRDEKVFADPGLFDIDRSPNPHLAFGKGIHFCLGAPLARMQVKVALEYLMRETTAFSIDYARSELLDPRIICGARELSLNLTWTGSP